MHARGMSAAAAAFALLGAPQLRAVELAPEDPSPGGQFVVVVNRGASAADLSCWQLRSTGARLYVRPSLRLAPGATALLVPRTAWLRMSDRVRLYDRAGRLRSATPVLADRAGDDRVWYRTADGPWAFGRTVFGKGVITGHLERSPGRC